MLNTLKWLCLLTLSSQVYAEATLELPRGGWRDSAGAAAGFRQEVNYPAASVNTAGHSDMALIRGHIARHPKKRPAKLIVNGAPMPISVDENGNFSRPYSFGSGSNNVEIRSADGKQVQRVQFYDRNPDKAPARLRVILSWDSDSTDLDLHVVSPDGAHVFYGDRVAGNGGALDVDVTTGYGPEIYANPSPPNGVYHVFVNYFGGGDMQDAHVTLVQVTIVSQEGTLSEKRQTFQAPLRNPGELTLIKSFSYP
jgi:uncharacterized protein YfaP (DUF2135 family)